MRNIEFKKRMFFGLIFLLFLIVLISFAPVEEHNIKTIIDGRNENKNIVEKILINDKMAVYDRKENKLYFSSEYLLKNMKIKIKSKYSTKYEIIKDQGSFYLLVYSKKYYRIVPIVITKLPIINIIYLDNQDSDSFPLNPFNDLGSLYAMNNDYYDVSVQMMGTNSKKWIYKYEAATLNLRGTSSAYYHVKKSYRLKFSKNINMFNIYKDDVFALDALSTDNSKIRNLLSSELWNKINDNQKINNDLVGDYVEVFVNGYYKGLFVVKNKVTKKIVNLKNNGLLVKDVHKDNDKFTEELLNNKISITAGNYFLKYQIKKYDEEAFINFVYKLQKYYGSTVTYKSINDNLDIDNYINYMLLVILINGRDNTIYNKYYSLSTSHSKIFLTPWDMDLTWGLNWSYTEELNSHFDMNTSIDKEWLNDYISKYTDKKTYKLLKKRYWELRKNGINNSFINNYIDKYLKKLTESEAADRDSIKWSGYNIKRETGKIKKWAKLRLAFLDQYFK